MLNPNELLTCRAEDLKPGDEFWFDKPYEWDEYDPPSNTNKNLFAWSVIEEPLHSTNNQLFPPPGHACIVVAVEYADGARGSRLFEPGTEITIRREPEDEVA